MQLAYPASSMRYTLKYALTFLLAKDVPYRQHLQRFILILTLILFNYKKYVLLRLFAFSLFSVQLGYVSSQKSWFQMLNKCMLQFLNQ